MTRLNDTQRAALEPFINGARVHDLGSGDLIVTRELVHMGAEHVTAIDRHPARSYNRRVTCVEAFFENYREDVDVAFMGYPVNWSCGLAEIAAYARIVIYIGKNTDGTSCGSQALFEHLVDREVLVHVPDRCNTLIVYGPERVERDRLPEEHAKLTEDDKMWSYEELMRWKPMKQLKEFGCYVYVDNGRLKAVPENADGSCGDESESFEPESSADNHAAFMSAANEALGTNFDPAEYPGL